jgi:Rab-like protein 2
MPHLQSCYYALCHEINVCRYKELRQYCETIPCFCVANKIDVDYAVTSKSFAFPTKNELPFYFVSAADGTNVVQVFQDAIKLAWQYKHSEKDFVAEVCASKRVL